MTAGARLRAAIGAAVASLVIAGSVLVAPAAYAEAPDASGGASAVAPGAVAPSEPSSPTPDPSAPPQTPDPASGPQEAPGAGGPAAPEAPAPEPPAPAETSAPAETEPPAETEAPAETWAPAETSAASGDAATRAAARLTARVAAVAPGQSLTVSVRVSGLPQDAAVSAALIVAGTEDRLGDPARESAAYADPAPTVTNGEAAFELRAPVSRLDRTRQYEVLVWERGAAPTSGHVYTRGDVAVTAAQWDELTGARAEPGQLQWGVLERFRSYVEGPIAHGRIEFLTPAAPAGSAFAFPQITGGSWDAAAETGSAAYAGGVRFTGHSGALDLTLSNPRVTVIDETRAELSVGYRSRDMATGEWEQQRAVVASLDLSSATRTERPGGAVRWTSAPATLTRAGVGVFQDFYEQGQALDPVTFTVGAASDAKPVDPPKNPGTPAKPKPKPAVPDPLPPATADGGAQVSGSLSWGISSAFASYVTGPIAKGAITTSGVGSGGGGYLFPQAAGGSWDTASQTGSVQYSGVVTFTGHKGLLSESFSNPVITVTSASSGTITAGGRSFGLDLGSAAKAVGPNGEVTWSGVPVSGGISGGASGGSQYTLAADPLTFTVGSASSVSYGSTAVSSDSRKRTAAASPPATSGIRVLTPAEDLVPGGEIEFEAAGYEPNEREILVVLYSDPIVLDDQAGANRNGVVRWIGTLPEDLEPGEHTVTLQGSADAGAVIEVLPADAKEKTKRQVTAELAEELSADGAARQAAAGVAPAEGTPLWVWWAAALGLLAVAGTTSGLVVAQRRNAA